MSWKFYTPKGEEKNNPREMFVGPSPPVSSEQLWLDTDEVEIPRIGLVTALPGSPVDGQEVYYLADATNGVVWRLRYRAFQADGTTPNPSAYKWEFLGGSPIVITDAADRTASLTVNSFLSPFTSDCAFDPVLAGYYQFDFVTTLRLGTTAPGTVEIGFRINASTPTVDVDTSSGYCSVAGARQTVRLNRVLGPLGVGSGSRVNIGYYQNAATQNVSRSLATMTVIPVRVG